MKTTQQPQQAPASSYQNSVGSNSGSNPYSYYPQQATNSLKPSQVSQMQQQQQQQLAGSSSQQQQQSSNAPTGYSRSQSRNSQHQQQSQQSQQQQQQNENQQINSSLLAKYSKQNPSQVQGGSVLQPSSHQNSQMQRDSNYNNNNNNNLNNSKLVGGGNPQQQVLSSTQQPNNYNQSGSSNTLTNGKISSSALQSQNISKTASNPDNNNNNSKQVNKNASSTFQQASQLPTQSVVAPGASAGSSQQQLGKHSNSQLVRPVATASQNSQQPSVALQVKKRKSFECGGTTFCVDDNYEFNKQIGAGAYGVVCSAVDLKTDKKVAIKKIKNAFEDLVDAKRILREIKMLKFLSHENIISLYDVIVPENRTGYEDIYIVTELMETDLHRVIYSRQELTDDHIQHFLYQTLCGLQQMHSANIMHRDLKPANILVNKNCDLKICDLGLARGFDDEAVQLHTEYVVTRWYRAPEVILKAQKYTKAVDVWSVGCIFAELLGRTPLFPGQTYLEQIQRIIAILGTPSQEELRFIQSDGPLKYVKGLPKRSKQNWENLFPNQNPVGLDLLQKMLTFNPDDRYTVEECLKHPYFESYQNPDEELPVSEPFDWTWDDFKLSKEKLQSMVYDEAVSYQKVKLLNEQTQNNNI